MRKCPICSEPIPVDLRKDSVYCSDYCRKMAYEFRSGRIYSRKRRIFVRKPKNDVERVVETNSSS